MVDRSSIFGCKGNGQLLLSDYRGINKGLFYNKELLRNRNETIAHKYLVA